jgi:predicted hydrocarbon binding protein
MTGPDANEGKYKFTWDLIGDIKSGRPNLGFTTRLEVYRLMQYTLRHVIEQEVGTKAAERIFYNAGKLAGTEFFRMIIKDAPDPTTFVKKCQDAMQELGIGILRFEKTEAVNLSFVMTVSEDLDCSGLPDLGYAVCTYDEGFIAGILEAFTGKQFHVVEVDCWCTGDRTCRFTADPVS